MFRRLVLSLALLSAAVATVPAVHAQPESAAAIQQRMIQRLPQIDALKKEGRIGENNRALLEARAELTPEQAAMVEAENKDRTAVYALIARQTGASPADVAKARARKIAEGSAKGVWLQGDDGAWSQKP